MEASAPLFSYIQNMADNSISDKGCLEGVNDIMPEKYLECHFWSMVLNTCPVLFLVWYFVVAESMAHILSITC